MAQRKAVCFLTKLTLFEEVQNSPDGVFSRAEFFCKSLLGKRSEGYSINAVSLSPHRNRCATRHRQWQGFALAPVLVAGIIMALGAAAAAIVAQSQFRQQIDSQSHQEALYAAEMGLQTLIQARLAHRDDQERSLCYPFNNNSNAPNVNPVVGIPDGNFPYGSLNDCMNVRGNIAGGVVPVCNAYDERILDSYSDPPNPPAPFQPAGGLTPNDDTYPGSFKPLAVWPVGNSSTIRAPMNTSGLDEWIDLDNSTTSIETCTKSGLDCGDSKRRAQLALFNLCDNPLKCGASAPPCPKTPWAVQVVSIGEVQRGDKLFRRAVAVDITTPFLYAGVIDRYVDITLMWAAEIRGPLHVNGICDEEANRVGCSAFFAADPGGIPLGVGAPFTDFDSTVSVSFPEDPLNPDGIRDDLSGFAELVVCGLLGSPACDITFVHLDRKVPIPNVRWRTFENRLIELYVGAAGGYGGPASGMGGPNRWLARLASFYSNNDRNDEESSPQTFWRCADKDYSSIVPHGDNRRWADMPWRFIRTCAESSAKIVWSPGTFFDRQVGNSVGTPDAAGGDYRNMSLPLESVWVYTGINFDNILGGSCNFGNLGACIGTWVDYPRFGFIGSHEFSSNNGNANSAFFVDGHIAMGEPTPWHSCGPASGGLFGILNWDLCLVIGPWVVFGFTILPQILIGMPHWHVGWINIKGEMLINGQLHLSDKITIDGGAVYATSLIQKAGSSGLKITFDVLQFILQIIKCIFFGCADLCIPLVGLCLIGDVVYGIIVAIFGSFTITLFEHDVTLQIIGGNASIPNSGLLYSRTQFTYKAASSVTFSAVMAILSLDSLLGGFFNFGLGIEIANGRVQLDDGGTIAVNGDAANENDGGILLLGPGAGGSKDIDLQVKDINGNGDRVGYLLAEGRIRTQEIGEEYKTILGFDTDETIGTARGVFLGSQAFQGRDDCVFHTTDQPVDDLGDPRTPGPYEDSVSCLIDYGLDLITEGVASFVQRRNVQIQGHIFAGKIHSMIASDMVLVQDSSVLRDVLKRNFIIDPDNLIFNYYEVPAPN